MQFDSTINRWHTSAVTGKINGSNPCSEYMHLDNSACNLASLNLMGFTNDDDTFNVEGYKVAIEHFFCSGDPRWPSRLPDRRHHGETSRQFRQLGLNMPTSAPC
ncbi:MAG: hypothetical protein R2706_03545 [Acidimicrobiales bacterium]